MQTKQTNMMQPVISALKEMEAKDRWRVRRTCSAGLRVQKDGQKPLIDWEYSMGREGSLLRCMLILCMLMMGIFLMYRMWHFFVCRRARCAAKRKWKHRARRRK